MNNLVEIVNDQVVVSSYQIAKNFEKEHKNILRLLSSKLSGANSDRLSKHFSKTTYQDETGKSNTMYLMDRDGFSFLVMGFTGEKADKWKLDYIDAFNKMEIALKKVKQIPQPTQPTKEELSIRDMEATAKLKEATIQTAELWLRLADRVDVPTYKQIAESYAFNSLAGDKVLPLPVIKEQTYSATEIGELLGVSANKIGAMAKKHNLKIDKYGEWVWDKARYSTKQVQTFRYYKCAIDVFKQLLIGGAVA